MSNHVLNISQDRNILTLGKHMLCIW